MNSWHKWRIGERVVCTFRKSSFYGVPANIIKRVTFLQPKGEYVYSLEAENGRGIFCAVSSSMESLEERPEEKYKPANNRKLKELFPDLVKNL